jgi:N-acetylglucosaminyl-diphospho-decaprenol L-rhamnosyltransferase
MKISLIIVNYNTPEILAECIRSIFNFEKNSDFEIIIVDNNSTDNSVETIRKIEKDYERIKTVFIKEGRSFSYANNKGFEASSGGFILIMNPDIIFTEPVLGKLTGILSSEKDAGAVSPLLTGQDGKFQRNYYQRYPTILQFIFFYSVFSKFFYRFPALMNRYLENQDIENSANGLVEVEQIPCAFFLTKREVFERAGGMDESYKLFFEDVDLSYQVHKSRKLYVYKKNSVTHLGGASFKADDNWWLYGRFIMSMIRFFEKNYGKLKSFLLKILVLSNSFIIVAVETIRRLFSKNDNYRYKKHRYLIKEILKH